MRRVLANSADASLAACLGGCADIGHPILTRDRFDYNPAISDFWKK
jgi:hypothetical protein